jgi:hypothetical protein
LIWLITDSKDLLVLVFRPLHFFLSHFTSGHVYFQMTYYNYYMANQTNYSNISINYLPCYIEYLSFALTDCTQGVKCEFWEVSKR